MVTAQANLDQTLLALADPTRRAILRRLSRGEARVTELAQPFDMSLNAVSKHIRILERSDLVRRRTAGREHFLSFNRQQLDELATWIETQRAEWNARLDALEALLKAEDEAKSSTHKKRKKGISR
jgi:DNA-binding transcriptional ArsR family regulator